MERNYIPVCHYMNLVCVSNYSTSSFLLQLFKLNEIEVFLKHDFL